MKKSLQILALLFCIIIFAQAPEKFSYQAVIRNASNVLVTNSPVGMKISILKTSAAGTVVYAETQTATTNLNGLVSIQIGAGTVVTGTIAGINWGADSYYIKTETDPAGGTNYTIAGTTQLLSVPYAMFAKSSASGAAFTLPYVGTSSANNITPFKITNSGTTQNSAGYFENTDVGNTEAAITAVNNSTGGPGTGIRGIANANTTAILATGVRGDLFGTGTSGAGVLGQATYGYGVYGVSTYGDAVIGYSNFGTAGSFAAADSGKALATFGKLQFANNSEGDGKVLTSDALGNATWQNGVVPKVHFSSTGGSLQTIPPVAITVINSWLGLEESGGANYNPATGEYTIPITGYYAVKAQIGFSFSNTTANEPASVRIQVNGLTAKQSFSNYAISGEVYSDTSVNLEKTFTAGQKIRIAASQDGNPSNSLFPPITNFSIHLIHQ